MIFALRMCFNAHAQGEGTGCTNTPNLVSPTCLMTDLEEY